MLPGPTFNVEMITSARRLRYYAARLLYAGALLVGFWNACSESFLFHGQQTHLSTTANLTAEFFAWFAWMQVIAVVALGPAIAAGTIASERQRRTIEYLFTSTLSNSEIVLGKLLARLLNLIAIVLVGVPVLALAMMLGGIAPEALLLLTILTLSTAVSVTVLSIAISVWSVRPRDAVTRAYLVLAVLLIVPPIIQSFLQSPAGIRAFDFAGPVLSRVTEQAMAANPFTALTVALYQAGTRSAGDAWAAVGVMVRNQMILAVLMGGLATWAVRRVHLHQSGRAPRVRRRWRYRLRPGLGDRPMFWKEAFAGSRRGLGWIGLIAAAILVGVIVVTLVWSMIVYLDDSSSWAVEAFLGGTILTLSTATACVLVLMLLVRSASAVTVEKERGSWDLLLCTPMEPREIVLGKTLGNLASMWPALGLMLLIWSFALLVDPTTAIPALFTLLSLVAIGLFAAALGVAVSLRCKSTLWAMGLSAAIGLYVGGMYMMCCCSPFMFALGPGDELWGLILAPCVPFLLAAPGGFYLSGESMLRHEPTLLVAYMIGLVGYPLAAAILIGTAASNFDRITGRTHARGFGFGHLSDRERASVKVATGRTPPPTDGSTPIAPMLTGQPEAAVDVEPMSDPPPNDGSDDQPKPSGPADDPADQH